MNAAPIRSIYCCLPFSKCSQIAQLQLIPLDELAPDSPSPAPLSTQPLGDDHRYVMSLRVTAGRTDGCVYSDREPLALRQQPGVIHDVRQNYEL